MKISKSLTIYISINAKHFSYIIKKNLHSKIATQRFLGTLFITCR